MKIIMKNSLYFWFLVFTLIEFHHVEGSLTLGIEKIANEIRKVSGRIHDRIFPNHIHGKNCRHEHNTETQIDAFTTESVKTIEDSITTQNSISSLTAVPDIDIRSGLNELTATGNVRQPRNDDIDDFNLEAGRRIIQVGCRDGYRAVNGRCRQIA